MTYTYRAAMTYTYRAAMVRVVDGDTVDLQIDLGFYMKADLRFRIAGIDTPELRGGTPETKAAARDAKRRVMELLEPNAYDDTYPLIIHTKKADSFGRWLATVQYPGPDGQLFSLGATLIAEGHAVEYKR